MSPRVLFIFPEEVLVLRGLWHILAEITPCVILNYFTSSPLDKPRCYTGWPEVVIVRIPGGYPLRDPIVIFIVLLCKLEEPCLSERNLVRVIVVELIQHFLAKFTSIVSP